jgi:fucose 4-O-acetylase-like acetyltransferase
MSPVPRGEARLAVLDWMKAGGMALIVLGHVAAPLTEWLTPPIYLKQAGVAFFVFAIGVLLARERRPAGMVVLSRAIEILLLAGGLAVLESLLGVLRDGNPRESNYLPLLLGMNVFLPYFPANPTTWFVGTYLHLLLLWLAVRRWRFGGGLLGAFFGIEFLVRTALIGHAGGYQAYMFVANWLGVFALGLWVGGEERRLVPATGRRRLAEVAGLLVLGVLLARAARGLVVGEPEFPFMNLGWGGEIQPALISLSMSLWYLGLTWAAFRTCSTATAPAWVRFFSRNTLVIFLAHMPVLYALRPVVGAWGMGRPVQWVVLFVACFPALALASEWLLRVVPVRVWSRTMAERWQSIARGAEPKHGGPPAPGRDPRTASGDVPHDRRPERVGQP